MASKVWIRADSTGYVSEFEVYTGKGTGVDDDELGHNENVVMKLTKQLQHKGNHIYCDHFFSSPTLFNNLQSVGVQGCGTVQPDQKEFPHSHRDVDEKHQPM